MKNHDGEGNSDEHNNMVENNCCIDISKLEEEKKKKQGVIENLPVVEREEETSTSLPQQIAVQTVVTVVITNGDSSNQFVTHSDTKGNAVISGGESQIRTTSDPKLNLLKVAGTETVQVNAASAVSSTKKTSLSRSESFHDYCRVCQQQAEEDLIDLGCQCRGGLAKAHRSCIDTWFRTKGSNKCEICQQVAINVPPPESQPSRNYWVWRVNTVYTPFRGGGGIPTEGERGCYSPLWVAFSILIGGLLLDVLISISLGVSALPVNIIIGVLVVLGIGTALRLALECCHELTFRRTVQGADGTSIGPLGYHPAV